jgi:RNA ligase (TIGR02306 family)
MPGEIVSVSEKINGESWRCVFYDREFHVGSHTTWKKREPENIWWKLLTWEPSVEKFGRNHPDVVVYGEAYGGVGGFSYNVPPGTRRLAVFDLFYQGDWMNVHEAREFGKDLPWVPLLAEIPFDIETIRDLAEGDTALPGAEHIREGCVVKPLIERTHPEIGRVQLKLVSNTYLEGKGKKSH